MYALPSNNKLRNSTIFQIHDNCVAMETKLCVEIKELNMSEGWFVYTVLLKQYHANVLCFILKLYKYECGWGKL